MIIIAKVKQGLMNHDNFKRISPLGNRLVILNRNIDKKRWQVFKAVRAQLVACNGLFKEVSSARFNTEVFRVTVYDVLHCISESRGQFTLVSVWCSCCVSKCMVLDHMVLHLQCLYFAHGFIKL